MAKLTLNNVASFTNDTSAVTTTSANNDAIETAMENTLSRDGTSPNTMSVNLDMNNNRVINVAAPVSGSDAINKTYGDANYGAGAQAAAEVAQAAAEAAQVAAELAETHAETAETNAETAETNAAASAAAAAISADEAQAAVGGVKVSSDDTTPGDLEAKILVGTGLSLATGSPGGNETRTISLDAQLVDIAGLTPTDNGVVIGNGSNFVVESGATLKTSLGLTIGSDVQAYDADILTADTTDVIADIGFTTTPHSYGTGSGAGTITIDLTKSVMGTLTNGGSFTLAPDATYTGYCVIRMVNNASAGTVTTSGWDNVDGDALNTTNTNVFYLHCFFWASGYAELVVRADGNNI